LKVIKLCSSVSAVFPDRDRPPPATCWSDEASNQVNNPSLFHGTCGVCIPQRHVEHDFFFLIPFCSCMGACARMPKFRNKATALTKEQQCCCLFLTMMLRSHAAPPSLPPPTPVPSPVLWLVSKDSPCKLVLGHLTGDGLDIVVAASVATKEAQVKVRAQQGSNRRCTMLHEREASWTVLYRSASRISLRV
jgi:hypothetical protein